MAIASDFTFATHLGFAKAHNKLTLRRNVGVILGYVAPQNCGAALKYFCNSRS